MDHRTHVTGMSGGGAGYADVACARLQNLATFSRTASPVTIPRCRATTARTSTDGPEASWPKLSNGEIEIRCPLPRRLFNEGSYRLELFCNLHHREWISRPGYNGLQQPLDIFHDPERIQRLAVLADGAARTPRARVEMGTHQVIARLALS